MKIIKGVDGMLVFKEFMAEPTELEFLMNEWMENNADCEYEIVNVQYCVDNGMAYALVVFKSIHYY